MVDLKYILGDFEYYFVGGCVRDEILGKKSKDIDILVANRSMEDIINHLSSIPNAKVDLVGKSFGIIKFTLNDLELDISVPRSERKISNGHKGFEVSIDNVTIEDDLLRRDFTINTLLKSSNGEIIDLHNGISDLKNKTIRKISENSFSDDPLRILRAIQFSSRFGFDIEESTLNSIKKNHILLTQISKERVLIEMDKLFHKTNNISDINKAIYIMFEHGICETLGNNDKFIKLESMNYTDFLIILFGIDNLIDNFPITTSLKNDLLSLRNTNQSDIVSVFDNIKKTDYILKSQFGKNINKDDLLLRTQSDLDICPKILIENGYTGKDISDNIRKATLGVLKKEVINNKVDLLKYILYGEGDRTENIKKRF